MTRATPLVSPRSGGADLLTGLSLPVRAVGLLFRSGKVFALSCLAAAVTFASMVGIWLFLHAELSGWFSRFVWTEPSGGIAHFGWYLVYLLVFLVMLLVGINTVPLLVLAPLQDPISEAAESALTSEPTQPFSLRVFLRSIWVALVHNAVRIGILLIGQGLLLILLLFPAVAPAWTFLSAGWTAVWLTGEYLSGPMARHLYPFGAVLEAMGKRKWLTLGFGLALYVLFWIPLLNLFFIPLGVVAGTLLYVGLLEANVLAPPPA